MSSSLNKNCDKFLIKRNKGNLNFMITTAATLLLMSNQTTVIECQPIASIQQCLLCDDFNRQNKALTCATVYDDCGDCKPGFIQDEKDFRLCFQIEILEGPEKDMSKDATSTVILPCIFNANVHCVWTKNGQQVVIDQNSRYRYINGDSERKRTHDCGIVIEQFEEADQGQWQCGSAADSKINEVKGKAVQLLIKTESANLIPTIQLNNKNVNGGVINLKDLQANAKRRRRFSDETDSFVCRVDVLPSRLHWTINGGLIGGRINHKTIHLDREQVDIIKQLADDGRAVQLQCTAEYYNGEIRSSYVNLRVTDLSSIVTVETTESVVSTQVFSGESYETFVVKTFRAAMITAISVLLTMFVFAIVASIVFLSKFRLHRTIERPENEDEDV